MTDAIELKPCPFCGDPDANATHCNDLGWFVVCASCGASGPTSEEGRDAAESAWNDSPIEDALRARIAELETQLCSAYGRAADIVAAKAKSSADNANDSRVMGRYENAMAYDRVEEALEAAAEEIRKLAETGVANA
jgi:Lar family restriction alleviation protein